MLFVLFIPLIIFIIAEIFVLYNLISIAVDIWDRYGYDTDVFIERFTSAQAILYMFLLLIAILIAALIYSRLVIRPVMRDRKRRKIQQEMAYKRSLEEEERLAIAKAIEIGDSGDTETTGEESESVASPETTDEKPEENTKAKKEKKAKENKKQDGGTADEPKQQ